MAHVERTGCGGRGSVDRVDLLPGGVRVELVGSFVQPALRQGSLEAFKERDEDAARAICNRDDEVDALYDQVYKELLVFMLSDPKTIERATRLTWVAHNLERIADRVTNICERVVYLVEGRVEELNVSKY